MSDLALITLFLRIIGMLMVPGAIWAFVALKSHYNTAHRACLSLALAGLGGCFYSSGIHEFARDDSLVLLVISMCMIVPILIVEVGIWIKEDVAPYFRLT